MERSPTAEQRWTVARLLAWTRDFFQQRGVESPRLCAELLLAHVLGCERIRLFTRFEFEPDVQQRTRYRELVKAAAEGAPVAHLIGVKEFYSLEFRVTPEVLVPRPETEVLVERTISLVREGRLDERAEIVDVGTGSGCIAVALAVNLPEVRLTALDVSPAALEVARDNAARHGVAERIRLVESDLFSGLEARQQFDAIVSNPPYLAETRAEEIESTVRDYEPRVALFAGPGGLEFYQRLVAEAPERVRPGGTLLVETAYDQAAEVRELLAAGAWTDILAHKDALRHERVLQARRRAD